MNRKPIFLSISISVLFSVILLSSNLFNPDIALADESSVPDWFRGVAGFWAEGNISTEEFVDGIEFLIGQGIILVPSSMPSADAVDEATIDELWASIGDLQTQVDNIELIPGPPGVNGADGIDGVNGADGIDGVDGADGTDGAPGPDKKLIVTMRAERYGPFDEGSDTFRAGCYKGEVALSGGFIQFNSDLYFREATITNNGYELVVINPDSVGYLNVFVYCGKLT